MLLRYAAQTVSSVMGSRGWRVLELQEFFPRGYSLLGRNWNRGRRIEIRLRKGTRFSDEYAYPPNLHLYIIRFIPFVEVVGTLLHELVHNSIGPHNKDFKSLLAQITAECEAAMIQKLIIPTIVECGYVLGGDSDATHQYSQRELTAFAAEIRLASNLPPLPIIDICDDESVISLD